MSALLEDSTAAVQDVQALLKYTLDTGMRPVN
jgi:hypothetical protein